MYADALGSRRGLANGAKTCPEAKACRPVARPIEWVASPRSPPAETAWIASIHEGVCRRPSTRGVSQPAGCHLGRSPVAVRRAMPSQDQTVRLLRTAAVYVTLRGPESACEHRIRTSVPPPATVKRALVGSAAPQVLAAPRDAPRGMTPRCRAVRSYTAGGITVRSGRISVSTGRHCGPRPMSFGRPKASAALSRKCRQLSGY